ncbi:MAG: LuxR C-terminal-related transcriptional regulator [Actinobacteria bacterium]|nr:LuxR C-terminal-related transcriptional regulator [Actinomycetota bacterium]
MTNAARHAGRVPVSLTLNVDDEHLALELTNPLTASRSEAAGGGRGLHGIEERVLGLHGHVSAGAREGQFDGIEATRRLLANVDDPPRVLVLTTFENDDYVFDALRAGAAGFLLKRAAPDEVVRAIRLLAAGDSLLFPAAIRDLAARHAPDPAPTGLDSAGLTDREAEVLRLIAEGLSNAEIAAQLIVSTETVKSHVAHILTKLDARDRTQAVIRAYQTGFINPG